MKRSRVTLDDSMIAQLRDRLGEVWGKQSLAKLNTEIERRMAEGASQDALRVLLLNRNFLAACLGEKQWDHDIGPDPESTSTLDKVLATKRVAIFCQDESLGQAIIETLEAFGLGEDDCLLFSSAGDVLPAVLEGRLCGIIAIWPANNGPCLIGPYLKQMVADQFGWPRNIADLLPVPPSFNFIVPAFYFDSLAEVIRVAQGMRKGELINSGNLVGSGSIVPFLWIPPRPVRVAILDDSDNRFNIYQLLEIWPLVEVVTNIRNEMSDYDDEENLGYLCDADVIFLTPEAGRLFASRLIKEGGSLKFVALTDGQKPDYADWQLAGIEEVSPGGIVDMIWCVIDRINKILMSLPACQVQKE